MKPFLANALWESTCTRDLTTSAGKIDTQNATPPKPPQKAVRNTPISSFVLFLGVNNPRLNSLIIIIINYYVTFYI